MTWVVVVILILALWAITRFYLRGEDLSHYDTPRPPVFAERAEPSEGHKAILEYLDGFRGEAGRAKGKAQLQLMRERMDAMSDGRDYSSQFIAADAGGVPGEWVLAPGADSARRFLYIHGGAYMLGSPKSHRSITSKLSEITGCSVFAVDYRLMPEHPRRAGIDDCRQAYQWLLENGPNGAEEVAQIFVGGDSAGGNLTLSLIAWLRDQAIRTPNAAVVLSPATDGTLSSPSLRHNVATDAMLGPQFGQFAKVPNALLLWMGWFKDRIKPSDPSVSPVFGDLAGLPPLLIHASEAEMLLDDSVRYTNRSQAHGSSVTLQTWPHMVHVWHIFESQLSEAEEAFAEIAKFLETVAPSAATAPVAGEV